MGAAVELNALLKKHHIDLTSDEVLGEMDAAFAAIPGTGAATLSVTEVGFLAGHGGSSAAAVVREWAASTERQARARVAVQALTDAVEGSISEQDAAEILDVDRSHISRRIGKTLWAFDIQGQWRIPRWQFLGAAALLPGLDSIVPAIPGGVPPAVLEAFMRSPLASFDDQTPIEYLAAGGDPRPVAEFIQDLSCW